MSKKYLVEQGIPLFLTFATAAVLTLILWLEIQLLNSFTTDDIITHLRLQDVLIGLTIYLKTSIDFAIYIANLMSKNPGWKSRVSIEIGTAAGNAAGTLAILIIWALFKEVWWLLAFMIAVASLVLFEMAEEGLEHAEEGKQKSVVAMATWLRKRVVRFNAWFHPVLRYIVPHISMKDSKTLPFWRLFGVSFTVPFILGLDDFAGYVPLFSIINVFGFAVGVFAGHMILNAFLFISPRRTVAIVKNSVISFLGSIAFIGLGIWGLVEVVKIIIHQ